MFRTFVGLRASRQVLLAKSFPVKGKSISSSAPRLTDRVKVEIPVDPVDQMGPIELFVYKEAWRMGFAVWVYPLIILVIGTALGPIPIFHYMEHEHMHYYYH